MFYVSVGEFISSWGNACDNEGWEEKVINEMEFPWHLWSKCCGEWNEECRLGDVKWQWGARVLSSSSWLSTPVCSQGGVHAPSKRRRRRRQGQGKRSQWGSDEKQTWNGTRRYFSKMSFKLPMRTAMKLPRRPIPFLAILLSVARFATSPTFLQMGSSGSWWVYLSHLQIPIH